MSYLKKKIRKEEVIKVLKVIVYIIIGTLTSYIAVYTVNTIFNLGTHTGTFIRNLYQIVCQNTF